MADERSEEEQLEVIKRWWKDNGTSLIAGAVLAAAGVFGWHAWQDYQDGKAEAASVRYQQLVAMSAGSELDDSQLASAQELVAEIHDEHGKSLYADLASLLEARLLVQQDDLAGAREALQEVADSSSRAYLKSLAWLRLARVEIADGNPGTALELLDKPVSESLGAQQANVRGDAYAAQGDTEQARSAWQNAIELADSQNQALYGVQFKLDDLGAKEATQQ